MSRSRIALGIAGLPGVLLFLASVGTASAECAWVLWDNEWSLERSFWERWVERDTSKWVVSDAFEKKQECERAKEEKLRAPWNQSKPGGPQIRFYCFPATVDPRGSKGR